MKKFEYGGVSRLNTIFVQKGLLTYGGGKGLLTRPVEK